EHYTLDMQGILTGMLVDKGTENEAIPDVGYADLALESLLLMSLSVTGLCYLLSLLGRKPG
ncbi:hypothetical protein VJI72_08030, partial [Parvimonas micra]|uniref:hypothetical protein n=1 Tax=Parvimonas micra TaxID=33033 RepID=UPI002B46A65F